MLTGASGLAVYGGVIGTLAFVLAALSFGWNVKNSKAEQRARRRPDVHGSLLITQGAPRSQLVFANAGPSVARLPYYLLVEGGVVYQDVIGTTSFLQPNEQAVVMLPFASTAQRSDFVWAYMDTDHNVHARSNNGDHYVYEHPTRVEMGQVFQRFYPGVSLPSRPTQLHLGEV